MSITAPTIDEAWAEYKLTGCEAARNQLIEQYMPMVRRQAEILHARLPEHIDLDDMISAGVFGLMAAIDRFDPARGIRFATYATMPVRGAMLDELRAMDWIPRLTRQRAAMVQAARHAIESATGQPADDDEVQAQLGLSDRRFARVMRDAEAVGVSSLESERFDSEAGRCVHLGDVLTDQRSHDPAEVAEQVDFRRHTLRVLPSDQRLMVTLYCWGDMTMRQIGEAFGLSESRVSQNMAAAARRLRETCRERAGQQGAKVAAEGEGQGAVGPPMGV